MITIQIIDSLPKNKHTVSMYESNIRHLTKLRVGELSSSGGRVSGGRLQCNDFLRSNLVREYSSSI